MELFTAGQKEALDEQSMRVFMEADEAAKAIREHTLPETVAQFRAEVMGNDPATMGSVHLIQVLGFRLNESCQSGKTYPLEASVNFYTIDAHKLVVHDDLLRECKLAFYRCFGIQPDDHFSPQVQMKFTVSEVPTLQRYDYPTMLTISVLYGPQAPASWKNLSVTL